MALATAQGKFPSHTTKTCSVLGLAILGTKEVNWKVSVDREKVRGMARNPLGVTEGDADYEFSATFLRPEWEKLKARIRSVYGVAPMDCKGKVVIVDQTPGNPVRSIEIKFEGLSESDTTSSQGSAATETKVTFVALDILEDGLPMIDRRFGPNSR